MLEVVNKIIEMSIQASFVICIILIVRYLFLKLNIPKQLIQILWVIPLFRLVCPVTIATGFSIVPLVERSVDRASNTYDVNVTMPFGDSFVSSGTMSTWEKPDSGNVIAGDPNIAGGTGADNVLTGGIEQEFVANIVEEAGVLLPLHIFAVVWMVGIACLVVYSVISTIRLRKKLVGSICVEKNYYRADHIQTPFVLGVFRPKIYLPSTLPEHSAKMIIKHEELHILRKDHIVKLIVFAITCVYWFNPFVWMLYVLFCRDIENAVDEKVVCQLEDNERQLYATLLLALSTGNAHLFSAPLAFGEGDVKGRIKNVVKYKKPIMILVIVAVIVAIVLGLSLITNQKYLVPKDAKVEIETVTNTAYPELLDYALELGSESFLTEEQEEELIDLFRGTKIQLSFHTTMLGWDADDYCIYFWTKNDETNSGWLIIKEESAYLQDDHLMYKIKDHGKIYQFLEATRKEIVTIEPEDSLEEIKDDAVKNPVGLDEIMREEANYGYSLVAHVKSFLNDEFSEEVYNLVASDWDAFEESSAEERLLTSSIPGSVECTFDSWEECEEFVGISTKNPLKDCEWLTLAEARSGLPLDIEIAGVSKDIVRHHCTVEIYGNKERVIESVSMHAGYWQDGFRIALDANRFGRSETSHGLTNIWAEEMEFETEEVKISNGTYAIIIVPIGSERYNSAQAHFVIDDVLYSVRVTGEPGTQAEVLDKVKELLEMF